MDSLLWGAAGVDDGTVAQVCQSHFSLEGMEIWSEDSCGLEVWWVWE